MTNDSEKNEPTTLPPATMPSRWPIVVAGIVVALAIAGLVFSRHTWIGSWAEAGSIGDYFGLVGNLANAFALLIAFRELGLQRFEMRQNLVAQQDQAKAQREYAEAMNRLEEAQSATGEVTGQLAAAQERANTLQEQAMKNQQWEAEAVRQQALATYLSTYINFRDGIEAMGKNKLKPVFQRFEAKLVKEGILVAQEGEPYATIATTDTFMKPPVAK